MRKSFHIIHTLKVLACSFLLSGLVAQGDFDLEDLNFNSETYGDTIGPGDYLGENCIVFFGHENSYDSRAQFGFLNNIYLDLTAMGVEDVGIIGVGKDAYQEDLDGMIENQILPWVEDLHANDYPVWTDHGAVQGSTYFLDRDGELIYQFNIAILNPTEPEDYEYLINLILDFRAENGPSVFRIPEDTTSIQGAIEWSENGDIILISPGTYQERIDFLEKNITVASLLYSGLDPDMVAETILDGNLEGTVITINGGQDQSAILLGLTIKNGNEEQTGGGILIENSSPTIDRNIIRNNHAGECGGEGAGIAVTGESYPLIIRNEIHNNIVSGYCDCICYFGGGIFVDSTAFPVVGGGENLGNTFYENTADGGYDLFRDPPIDTTDWTPIFAHHNIFEDCPPDFLGHIYPENGWDLENCHTLLGVENDPNIIANDFKLLPSFPNPFNPTTKIRYYIVETQPRQSPGKHALSLRIFNINGQLIETWMDIDQDLGIHEIQWDATNQPSGIYFIQLRSSDFIQTQKGILVK